MPINSKQKGKGGEREIVNLLKENGYDARRSQQYCGYTGEAPDVIGLKGFHIEVKRVERLNIDNAMEQAIRDSGDSGEKPIVMHRRNGKNWLVTMGIKDFFTLLEKWYEE